MRGIRACRLGIPCFTLRDNTERPATVDRGTNTLIGLRPERIREIPALIERSRGRPAPEPIPGWDGHAAERIADVLERGPGAQRGGAASDLAPSSVRTAPRLGPSSRRVRTRTYLLRPERVGATILPSPA